MLREASPAIRMEEFAYPNIRLIQVDYSLDMLDEAYEAATSLLDQYGLNTVTIDIPNNRVILSLDKLTDQFRSGILQELAKLKLNDINIFSFNEEERAEDMSFDCADAPLDWSCAKEIDLASSDFRVMPGGWFGYGSSPENIKGVRSVTCAVLYNNRPFFVTAGHTKIAAGDKVYFAKVPSSGSYPTDLKSLDVSARLYVGDVAMKKLGGLFDFASVERKNSSALAKATAYNGKKLCGDTTKPAVGEAVKYTGAADRSVQTNVKSLKSSITYYGKTMKNIIVVYGAGISGTSGGPLMRNISGKEYLVGMASFRKPSTDVTMFTYFKEVKDAYGLVPVFPEYT